MAETLQARVAAALATIENPRRGMNVLDAGMVRDIATTTGGRLRLTLLLAPDDEATLVRDVRQALERVDGVADVRIDVKDASEVQPAASPQAAAQAAAPRVAAKGGRSLPMFEPPKEAAPRPQAPTPVAQPNLGNIIAISSGKGGVGKSTVATNLAIALARSGLRVGLMDADIYGPDIPRMMGVDAPPAVEGNRIIPLEAHGVKLMSLGFIIEREQPAIWRGPIIMKIITQFLRDVEWGQLDAFLVDMPPGTGDAQLSLVQAAQVHGAIIVTTPQQVAAGDALRGAMMFKRVGVPVLGIVENMSVYHCEHCGETSALFGSGGGARLAAELGVELLAQVPLAAAVLEGGDAGVPIVVAQPGSAAGSVWSGLAERVMRRVRESRAG
jgi:ATP-binding protein involved in chromosome partitioning